VFIKQKEEKERKKNETIFETLFSFIEPPVRLKVKVLQDYCRVLFKELRSAQTDSDGLYILDSSNPIIRFFRGLFQPSYSWHHEPILVEFLEIMMKSRQAPGFMWRWATKFNPSHIPALHHQNQRKRHVRREKTKNSVGSRRTKNNGKRKKDRN